MFKETHIDPMVSFRNSQGELARGTIINLQRKALVMEVYNPHSIVQVSEVLDNLNIRLRGKNAYVGKAVVISMVNTGLTAIVSLTLISEWRELSEIAMPQVAVGLEAKAFIRDWAERFKIRRDYQIVVNEMRAYLSEVSRWVEQVDLSESLPKKEGKLQEDFFYELATPLMEKTKSYMEILEMEASMVETELAPVHKSYAQSALHPLLLRAPFVFRTYTKPLGYAGDYMMVNQIIDDPRQGPNTYFQIVNTAFLQTPVAAAHRNRIDILKNFLFKLADAAKSSGMPAKVLNVGCGPALEIQRYLETYPDPEFLSFELIDFSAETLAWTKKTLSSIIDRIKKPVEIKYTQDSVHQLLKHRSSNLDNEHVGFNAVYCAGLFDYLSDKVCTKLTTHFASRVISGGTLLLTNVHSQNPRRFIMEHLLEWYLIYRDEKKLSSLFPINATDHKIYVDSTGVNVFGEVIIRY